MDLRELYQEVILDHNKRPRNFRVPDPVNRKAEGYNPLCGDKITVFLLRRGRRHQGSRVSGHRLRHLEGLGVDDDRRAQGQDAGARPNAFFDQFHAMVTAPAHVDVETDALGKLAVLAGVREYPMRVKCASLAWHTLKAAMQAEHDVVSTE